jgi:hypothetical protein
MRESDERTAVEDLAGVSQADTARTRVEIHIAGASRRTVATSHEELATCLTRGLDVAAKVLVLVVLRPFPDALDRQPV